MLLEIQNISKSFAGVHVLSQVSLGVHAGEVHALVGENGAGKSTLMKILAGQHPPDTGRLLLEGRELRSANTHEALRQGIATIYQELMPFPNLTVAENILIGQEPVKCWPGWIDRRELNARAARLVGQLGFSIEPTRRLGDLRVAEMQAVEIAKALAHRAKLVLMDEPTSALGDREAEALFAVIQALKAQGVAIIYISHRLEEVLRLADRVTVLRDGRTVGTHPRTELDRSRLIAEMVGRTLDVRSAVHKNTVGPVLLEVRQLTRTTEFRDVHLCVRAGEILGIAGLVGAGRTALLNAIYGLHPADHGEIRVRDCAARIRRPADALAAGIGLVTEDRRRFGFIPGFGAPANITLSALKRCCRFGWVRRKQERRIGRERIESLRIRGATDGPVKRLSGGNQQKVVLARTLFTEPDILLLDEPTRGIDIAAKAEVHQIIRELAQRGKAIVLASSELPELLALSDRLVVMREGLLVAEMDPAATSPEEVLKQAMPG